MCWVEGKGRSKYCYWHEADIPYYELEKENENHKPLFPPNVTGWILFSIWIGIQTRFVMFITLILLEQISEKKVLWKS